MKRFIGTLIATLMMTTSQASTNTINGDRYLSPNLIVTQRQIATPNVQGHAKHRRVLKSKVQRAVPFGMNDNDDDFVQSEDVATGYRRRDLTKIHHEDGISEKVRWRLFLARQLALLKHRELHA